MNNRKLFSDSSLCDDPYCDSTCPGICYLTCPSLCFVTTPPVHKSHKLEPLIISLSIFGLCCFIYCSYALYKLYKNTRRPLREPAGDDDVAHAPVFGRLIGSFRTVGLQPSTINLITAIKYKTGEGLVEGTDCSVCLSEFQDDETLRLLPKCNHAFHQPCIDTWLRSHTNCPMCRAPIVAHPNGALSPILEQSFQRSRSSVLENSQVAIVPEGSEARERENADLEQRMTDQPMRRSVSMDSFGASRLSNDITDARLVESSEINQGLMRFIGSCSFKKSTQKEPVLMERSFSCSGKVLFSRHNRDMKSVIPL